MRFMKTIDHAFKITQRAFPDGTEIDMDAQDDADPKTGSNVQQVGKVEPAKAKETLYGDIRV